MIPGFPTVTVESFNGQLDKAHARDVPKDFSPDCPNCAFDPGSVFTRPGTVEKIDWGADVTNVLRTEMLLRSPRRYLGLIVTAAGTEFAYFDDGDLSRTTLLNAATLDQDVTHFRLTIYGNLVFLVFSDGSNGQTAPYVWNPATGDIDSATSAAPTIGAFAAASGGAGSVSAGAHRIIVLYASRTGYETRPGDYITYTATADDSIDLTAIPTGGAEITDRIIGMTAGDDLRYFEVGRLGDNTTTTYTIDLSDEQLLNQRSLDGHFNFLHPLLNFLNVFEYNNRIVWVAPSNENSLIYISQPGLPVCVREDTGYLPIGREDGDRCTAAFQIRRALYITKTRAIWATQDTGGDPATWSKPYPICKWAGTITPSGVSQTSDKDEALILDIKGVLRFIGGDPILVSENVRGTFDRLNYAQTSKARMAIDPLERRVFAWVPLDSATNPDTLIVGDYKEGWDRSKWSLWTTDGTAWRDIVVDSAEVLIQEAGRYLSRFDDHANSGLPTNPSKNDRDGTAIDSYYVTGLIEPRPFGVQHIAGVAIYGSGAGNLDITLRNQDNVVIATPTLIVLAANPGKDFFRGMNARRERFFFAFGTDATNEAFRVNRLTFFVKPDGARAN